MSFTSVADGQVIRAAHISQFSNWLTAQKKDATASIVATSSTQYALTITSEDTTNGYIFKCADATGGTQFAVTQTGVSLGSFTGTVKGRLQDKNGFVVNLEAYTTATINTGVLDTDNAWAGAIAAVTASATTRGTIVLGPGTFLAPTSAVSLVSGLTIRGAGIGSTVIKHRDQSSREPLYAFGLSNVVFTDFSVDGNRSNNEHTSTGFSSSEVTIDSLGTTGSDNAVIRCRIFNFNCFGLTMAGQRHVAAYNQIDGPATATYLAVDGSATQTTFGGIYGIHQPGNVPTTGGLIFRNYVSGTRSAGIVCGGVGTVVAYNRIWDAHRGGYPGTSGGGCLAIAPTSQPGLANGTEPSRFMLLQGNHVGPTTVGTFAIGIELSTVDDSLIIGNSIENVPATGMSVNGTNRVRVIGNTFRSISTTAFGTQAQAGSLGNTALVIQGNTFMGNGTAIALMVTGTTAILNQCVVANNVFCSNTTNYTSNSTSVAYQFSGNIPVTGTMPGGFAATIAAATGGGLKVIAGATASDLSVQVLKSDGVNQIAAVFGNGQSSFSADASPAMQLNHTVTSATLRGLLALRSGAVTKGQVGLDTADNIAVMDSDGTTALLSIVTPTTSSGLGNLDLRSNTTATNLQVTLGRTGTTNEAILAVVGTSGNYLTGTVTGDTVFRANTNLILGSLTAAALTVRTADTQRLRVDSIGNVIVGGGTGTLTTTGTAGFLWIPYCSGTPTGNPGTPTGSTGSLPLLINGSANTLCFWNGAAWRVITSS